MGWAFVMPNRLCLYCQQPFRIKRGGVKRYCSTPCSLWSRVTKSESCWEWTGPLSAGGYGNLSADGQRGAHRVSKVLADGPVPDGLFVLHHCDNARCVRPDHLYFGTLKDNARDAVERRRHDRSRRDYCKRGHPLFGDNLRITSQGYRSCKTCERDHCRETKARQRQSRPGYRPMKTDSCIQGHNRIENWRRTPAGKGYCLACTRERARARRQMRPCHGR